MKILVTDLQQHIEDTVKEVNDACYNLRLNSGIQVQMPEEMVITVEVVKTFNDVTRTQQTVNPERTTNGTETTPQTTETRTTTPSGQQTVTSESGSNREDEVREYDEFEVEDPA